MAEFMDEIHPMPVGDLGIIAMRGCGSLVDTVNSYLTDWRKSYQRKNIASEQLYQDYQRDSYLLHSVCPRFGTGEGKGIITESVRGVDLYIICDCFNYGETYKMYRQDVPMSPDDHFQDLKRVIAATAGKARRITVIMPLLYEGRQHKRSSRESLDCSIALQELVNMGVDNIITFDAHDSRVQNAIPLRGFESIQPAYQMIKAMANTIPDLLFDSKHMMIISPDEGGMSRCIYYSNILGIDLGMFYKRRDYSQIVNGRNPIIAHEYLGDDISDKDVVVVDDMISSGDSIIDVARQLKSRNARRIFINATFGLFCEGLDMFDKAYEDGIINQVYTTNLIFRPEGIHDKLWYTEVSMCKYIAYIINTINHDQSISQLLDPAEKIHSLLERRKLK